MPQRDYILRMIEMMALMVRRIREMIVQGEVGAAEDALRGEAARAGLSLDLARAMDGETLLGLFMPPGASVDPTSSMLFGEILYLDGLQAQAAGDHEGAHQRFAKALLLLQAASSHATAAGLRFPETEERIAEIKHLLDSPPPG